MSVFQPVTQVRMTNVVVVRLKRKGQRFELACYPNKVISWREKTEKDLDEVLQIEQVFTNVSKGTLASQKQLVAAFGTDDVKDIIIQILEKGELQVSEKERHHQSDKLFQEIATLVAGMCVDPNTKRPFTVGMIERSMKDSLHYAAQPNKSAKQQALEVIRQLKEHIEIERAQMEIHITLPGKAAKQIREKLQPYVASLDDENFGAATYSATCLIDPGNFRTVEDIIKSQTKGAGTLEIASLAVMRDTEERLE
ncbi:Ribosome maturation protein SBDS [Porphyridium purpureum]|uniref:Ribosome maturation protein SBDS n=1 Tax=Porphyridium purpureum TaxID=35688 RepID=A0A5J4YZP7_PORPP|nr:Ribosome maturation protein SBDS [Porphyridium purpureum]|eukprot:POR9149..scf208_2